MKIARDFLQHNSANGKTSRRKHNLLWGCNNMCCCAVSPGILLLSSLLYCAHPPFGVATAGTQTVLWIIGSNHMSGKNRLPPTDNNVMQFTCSWAVAIRNRPIRV